HINYLHNLQEVIFINVNDFLSYQEEQQGLGSLLTGRQQTEFTIKYKVNLLVDNSETNGAPVVTADNPTFYNLIGKVEYESRMGVMSTNFTKIKPGFLHEANG